MSGFLVTWVDGVGSRRQWGEQAYSTREAAESVAVWITSHGFAGVEVERVEDLEPPSAGPVGAWRSVGGTDDTRGVGL